MILNKMNKNYIRQISKLMSLVLRHNPQKLNITLDKNGWTDVAILVAKIKMKHHGFTLQELEYVVINNDKKRFAFNTDKTKIRANQGHSITTIDLELQSAVPPQFLYHGTVDKFMLPIKEMGLQKQSRQHVHLSRDRETAIKVGSRRGKPIILSVRAGDMHNTGYVFYLSENGVWLTDHVPPEFIEFK